MVSLVGLLSNSVGVFLMLRYGLPDNLPQIGRAIFVLTDRQAAEDQRRRSIGVLGLVLFILGTTLQAIAMLRDSAF
jgi:hypothetical protein